MIHRVSVDFKTSWWESLVLPPIFQPLSLRHLKPMSFSRAENRPLNVPLIAPFTVASSRLEMVENVAIRIEPSNDSVGWGEAPILPFVTAEDQKTAMAKASEACAFLRRCPSLTLGSMLEEIAAIIPGHEFAFA
ncbi:L-Ala-D/L-amino acid epimerase [Arachis hypogaea]|nr:L-Ala-D/L-amino acid epimerase [Arachis hypogaea]